MFMAPGLTLLESTDTADTQNLNEVRYKLAVNLKLIHAWICSSNFKKEIE
jgi:hypothetical protein